VLKLQESAILMQSYKLNIKENKMTKKLYKHTTDGGAVYLYDTFIKWKHNGKSGKEGIINDETKIIVRLDGQPEIIIIEEN